MSDDTGTDSSSHTETVTFPHRVEAEYAKGFRIRYRQNYKLLEILKPFQDRVDTLRYALIPRKLVDDVQVKGASEIAIPVRSMIATSTTHIGLAQMLRSDDIITGMVGAKYAYSKEIKERLKKDKITGFPLGEFNKEQALNLGPDLLMISGGQSSQYDNYRVLMNTGIDVLVNAEWLETTPLGKAEWIKVLAALVNKEKLANKKFREIAARYHKLKAAAMEAEKKPLVITNLPYKGSWYVPGGNSYNANILKDAGARYPWGEIPLVGGQRKSFETMYQLGLKADYWINPGGVKSREDIMAKDARFKAFQSFQKGKIYNNNKRISPSGGNDFWESGVVHPEVILADLIKIFHPGLLPDHTLYYYQKVK